MLSVKMQPVCCFSPAAQQMQQWEKRTGNGTAKGCGLHTSISMSRCNSCTFCPSRDILDTQLLQLTGPGQGEERACFAVCSVSLTGGGFVPELWLVSPQWHGSGWVMQAGISRVRSLAAACSETSGWLLEAVAEGQQSWGSDGSTQAWRCTPCSCASHGPEPPLFIKVSPPAAGFCEFWNRASLKLWKPWVWRFRLKSACLRGCIWGNVLVNWVCGWALNTYLGK